MTGGIISKIMADRRLIREAMRTVEERGFFVAYDAGTAGFGVLRAGTQVGPFVRRATVEDCLGQLFVLHAMLRQVDRGKPLTPTDRPTVIVNDLIERINEQTEGAAVEAILDEDLVKRQVVWMQQHRKDQYDRLMKAADDKRAERH